MRLFRLFYGQWLVCWKFAMRCLAEQSVVQVDYQQVQAYAIQRLSSLTKYRLNRPLSLASKGALLLVQSQLQIEDVFQDKDENQNQDVYAKQSMAECFEYAL